MPGEPYFCKQQPKANPTLQGGKVRTHYDDPVETDWDYAPQNMDMITGKPSADSIVLIVRTEKQEEPHREGRADFRRGELPHYA